MNALLMVLVLFCVACGAEFHGDMFTDVGGEAGEPGAGAPPVAGSGGSNSTAGSSAGGSGAVAGSAVVTGGAAGEAGAPSAGAGGEPPVVCTERAVTMPAALSVEAWSTEHEAQCATMLEPLDCALTWQSIGWVDATTYEVQVMEMSCGFTKFNAGSCDGGGTCEPGVKLAVPGNRVRLVVDGDQVDQVLVQGGSEWGAFDVIGVTDNDCSPTVPTGWTGELQTELNRAFRAVLATSAIECS